MNKYFGSEDSILEVMKLSLALLAESSDECGDLLSGCGSLSPNCAFRLQVVHDTPSPMAGLARAPITCQGMVVAVARLSFNYHIPSIEGGDVREVDVLYRISSGEVFEISAA